MAFAVIYQTIRHKTCPHDIMLWNLDLSKSKRVYKSPKVAIIEFYYIWREHRAAIFEAILMAAICKIGSRLVPGYR